MTSFSWLLGWLPSNYVESISVNQFISIHKLIVAIISNQKKKLYLKSSATIVFRKISTAKNIKHKISKTEKTSSESLLNALF